MSRQKTSFNVLENPEHKPVNFLQIKLIALDLDGTALQDDHRSVSERMKRSISAAAAQGISVAVASGRIYSFLPRTVVSIPEIDWAVTSNGSVLYSVKEEKTASGEYIAPEDAAWVLRQVPPDMWAEVWSRGRIYIARDKWRRSQEYPLLPLHRTALSMVGTETEDLFSLLDSGAADVEKINLPLIPPAMKAGIRKLLSGRGKYSLVNEGHGIEVMGAGISKARGIRNLCRRLPGVRLQNVLAVGDSENDIDMLRECGLGVAMGNAADCVKAAADAVTCSNSEDGAALAIEKYAL